MFNEYCYSVYFFCINEKNIGVYKIIVEIYKKVVEFMKKDSKNNFFKNLLLLKQIDKFKT